MIKNFKKSINADLRSKIKVLESHGFYLESHCDSINCIALCYNAPLAVTGSDDCTVRLWDFNRAVQQYVFVGHLARITSVAISYDDRHAISSSGHKGSTEENFIRVWDISTKAQIFILKGHFNLINSLSVTADNKFIVSGSKDMTVRLWNLENGSEEYVLEKHSKGINFVVAAQLYIISADDHTIILWNYATKSLENMINLEDKLIYSISSNDSGRIVFVGLHGSIRVYDTVFNTSVGHLLGHVYPICSMSKVIQNKYILSLCRDSKLILWNINSLKQENYCELSTGCISLGVNTQGVILIGDRYRKLFILSTKDLNTINEFCVHIFPISCLSISIDTKYIVSGSRDCSVRVWDTESKTQACIFTEHYLRISCVSISSNNEFIVSGSNDGTLRLFTLKSEHYLIHQEPSALIKCISISYNNNYILSASSDNILKFWYVAKNFETSVIYQISLKITSIAFTKYDLYAVCGLSHTHVKVFKLKKIFI
jgi:WD40 repeat protein